MQSTLHSAAWPYNPLRSQPGSTMSPPSSPQATSSERQSAEAILASLGPDTFEPVGDVTIYPKNASRTYVVEANLSPTGRIFQHGLEGPRTLGQLDAQGNFLLSDGQRGNVFQGDMVAVLPPEQSLWKIRLEQAKRQRAIQASEIPWLRAQFAPWGLSGQGITVGIVDPQEKKPSGEWSASSHTQTVRQVINDPVWGVAPGAQVVDLGKPIEYYEQNASFDADTEAACVNFITQHHTQLYQSMTSQLHAVLSKNDPRLRILNITAGVSRLFAGQIIYGLLQQNNENGYLKYPQLYQKILGPVLNASTAKQIQHVTQSINRIIEQSPVVQQAYQTYVETTRQAASRGIIIVGAAGNQQTKWVPGLMPGDTLDEYSKSPYVLTIAAASTNQTPGNRHQYQMTQFSSWGDGQRWNPTIAAPGEEMGISFPAGKIGHNQVVAGTSYATPFTCGVIALMLQRNPQLTFDQVKARLQGTAIPLPNVPIAAQGAGILNAEAAVLSP